MSRAAGRHPEAEPVDPAECSARGSAEYARRGGENRMAALSPEEHSALSTLAADRRWGAHRAELAARGEAPKPANPPMPPDVLAYWKGVVREEQPDRVWTSAMQLKRAAIRRAKQEVARTVLDHRKHEASE